jgi:hypothetical protein
MPLPGQGYSHGSPLLDKANDKQETDDALDSLKARGKVTTGAPPIKGPAGGPTDAASHP